MIGTYQVDSIVVEDCLTMLRGVPDESIDLIATDPAYESLMRWKGVGTTARMGLGRAGSGSDDESKFFTVFPNADIPDMVQEFYRVLKPSTHCYIMCDFETLRILYNCAITEGVFAPVGYGGRFDACKPLIWDKAAIGTGYTYRQQYEFVFMLWKGPKKRKLNDLSIPDVLRYKRVWGKEKLVPTQKPVELFEVLIRQSTQPGEIVLDPFMGSGTTAIAAKRTGRHYLGCDVNEHFVRLAQQRLEQVQVQQMTMF